MNTYHDHNARSAGQLLTRMAHPIPDKSDPLTLAIRAALDDRRERMLRDEATHTTDTPALEVEEFALPSGGLELVK